MNVLILSDCDQPNSVPFEAAVSAAGIPIDRKLVAFAEPSDDLQAWHIRAIPCVAKIVDGKAVFQQDDPALLTSYVQDAAAHA